jgi:hypothetical protein
MTAISWNLSGDGFWDVASNWAPAQVPGAADTATIGVSGVTVTSNASETVGTTIVDDNTTLVVDSGTTFSTAEGSSEADGAITVDNGGNFEIGKDGSSENFDNVGFVRFLPGSNTSDLTIAGNVSLNGGSGDSTFYVDEARSTPSSTLVTGDGVGSPTLTLTDNESIILGDGGLSIAGLTLTLESGGTLFVFGGQLTVETGSNTVTNDGGKLEATANGELVIESPVNNSNGFVNAGGGDYGYEGGSLYIAAPITGASGTVGIFGYGMLELASGGSVSTTVEMRGSTGNTLRLDTGTSQLGDGVSGAVAGDNFDLAFEPFAAGDHAVWVQSGSSGALSLVSGGGTTLATLALFGQYTTANFNAVSDGHGGTLIQVVTPSTPAGTTADMIMQTAGGGSFGINNANYEIYNIGSNSILAANPLQLVASGEQAAGPYFSEPGSNFQIVGLGGFDGSDTSDVLMRDLGSDFYAGTFGIFDLSNNNTSNGASLGQVGLEWQVAGFGDFSSNPGETDMLLRNSSTGAFEVYDISGNSFTFAGPMGAVGSAWTVAGFGDFSGNANETDMLMRNSSTGAFEVYDISGNSITSAGPMGAVGLAWTVAGFGDFSGNANETDMLMRNSATGAFEVYDISGNSITFAGPMGSVGLAWTIAGFGDFSGNANETDMLMRNSSTGAFEVYDISKNAIAYAAGMGSVGTSWLVSGIAADPPGGAAPANAQLVQAMASMGATAPVSAGNTAQIGAESSAQPLVTIPQHG